MIHFNDSAVPFQGRHDHHGDLLGGYITNPLLQGNQQGLAYLAQFAVQHQITMVFETPCLLENHTIDQHTIVHHWVQGNLVNPDLYREIMERSIPKPKKKANKANLAK